MQQNYSRFSIAIFWNGKIKGRKKSPISISLRCSANLNSTKLMLSATIHTRSWDNKALLKNPENTDPDRCAHNVTGQTSSEAI